MDDYKNANDGAGSNIYRLVRGKYVTSRVARSKDIGTSRSVYISGYLRYVRYVLATQEHRILTVVAETHEFAKSVNAASDMSKVKEFYV